MLARAEPTHASMGGGARRRQHRRRERKGELFARSLSLQEDGAAIFVKQPRSGGRHPKPNHRSRLSLSRCLRARSRPTHLWEAERVADSIEDRRGKANWFARSRPPQEAVTSKKGRRFHGGSPFSHNVQFCSRSIRTRCSSGSLPLFSCRRRHRRLRTFRRS